MEEAITALASRETPVDRIRAALSVKLREAELNEMFGAFRHERTCERRGLYTPVQCCGGRRSNSAAPISMVISRWGPPCWPGSEKNAGSQ
jgi:hypothetical protein